MARKFATGAEHIRAAEKGSGGKRRFTPNIYWTADGENQEHIIAFLTPISEVPKVQLHKVVRIPDDSRDTGFRVESLICQKDVSMVDEFGGSCVVCEAGADVATQFVALAVELETVMDGRKIKELKPMTVTVQRDDGPKEYVRWGLVVQSAKNFFSYFAAYDETQGDIREVAWQIKREGGGTDTKYHSWIVSNGPRDVLDLPDLTEVMENIPDLGDLLEEMADNEKYAAVATIPAGTHPSFGGKDDKKKQPARESGVAPAADRSTDFDSIRSELEKDKDGQKQEVPSY